MVTRAIAAGRAKVAMHALVKAHAPARGHVECSGLLMSPHAAIDAIPQLAAHHQDAALTHEVSIGKLAEEVSYLQPKGFTYEEAVSLLVRGFVATDIYKHLPELMRRYVEQIERRIGEPIRTNAS